MNKVWNALQKENSILVCDFDTTLTTSGSSMHGLVHVLGEDTPFAKDRDRLFQKYGKKLSLDREIVDEKEDICWWKEQMELFLKYQITEEMFGQVAKILPVRREAVELLSKCQTENVPVWIVSAGIANVIEEWLKQQELDASFFQILANRVLFTDGSASGYTRSVIPSGKAKRFLKDVNPAFHQHLVFLGDRMEDLGWRKENAENFLVDRASGVVTSV